MRYLCDQMLGTLAKWLRIYGFDTYFPKGDMKDSELLDICKRENRVLITRDKNLIIRAKRENIKTIEICSIDLNEQIRIAISDEIMNSDKVLSRCILCNSLVDEIKKEDVKGKIPKNSFDSNEKFWYCKKCDKIYWKGSHFENMVNKINEIKKSIGAS
jgi:uncharacterized protein with PIN domain